MNQLLQDFPILNTKRLLLRDLRLSDIAALHRLKSDPVVVSLYYAEPKTYDQSLAKLNDLIALNERREALTWCVALAVSPDELIGTICLWNFRDDGASAEIGYELLPAYHNQGIMTEAAARVIEYGFVEKNVKTIDALVNPENAPSCRLLEKLGFQKGERSLEQEKDGAIREYVKYALER
jgi:ribosomal-protein-alanine N-acetyltransferase